MGNVIPFRDYDFMQPSYMAPYFVPEPESPETAIARQDPFIASDLLKDISKKVLYKNLAESSVKIAGTYLNCMKEVQAPSLAESSQLGITVLQEFTRQSKLSRLVFGSAEIGFSMTIRLR